MKMNLKTKVTIGALLFATLPILIASSLIGWIAVDSSKNALYELATQKVISIRDTKKAQIEDHFKNVRSQIAFSISYWLNPKPSGLSIPYPNKPILPHLSQPVRSRTLVSAGW